MANGRVFRVAINDVTLRAHLSREDGRAVTELEMRSWFCGRI